jgi:hypothetical protein
MNVVDEVANWVVSCSAPDTSSENVTHAGDPPSDFTRRRTFIVRHLLPAGSEAVGTPTLKNDGAASVMNVASESSASAPHSDGPVTVPDPMMVLDGRVVIVGISAAARR